MCAINMKIYKCMDGKTRRNRTMMRKGCEAIALAEYSIRHCMATEE